MEYRQGAARNGRILLPKNKFLKTNKAALEEEVNVFESGRKYSGHIALDVDPV